MVTRLRQLIKDWLSPCDRSGKVIASGCALILVLLVWYLISAEKPWDPEIQGKIAGGAKLKAHDYRVIGVWWASLICVGITLVCLVTVRRWGRAIPGKELRFPKLLTGVSSRGGKIAVTVSLILAVLVGGYVRMPRLDHSLWNDEEYAVRRNVWGEWKEREEGKFKFDKLTWEESLFFNHNNNHIMHTISARVALGAWQSASGGGDEAFSETAVRFFPFLAGLASIALVGLLGWTCGLPLTGAAAAFLMALSPWHLRYSVEARGYSSMIMFILIGLLALIMCLRGGRWRWWMIYGASQSAVLLCFLGAIYLVAAQNFFAVFAIIIRGKRRQWMLWRWAVASVVMAIPFILLIAPSVPQILQYFGRQDLYDPSMGFGWLRDFWSHIVGGIPWADQTVVDPKSPLWGKEAGLHLGTSVLEQNDMRNWVAPSFRLVVPALTFCGLVALCLKNWKTRLLVVAFVWAGVLFYAHNSLAGHPAHGWYLLFLLPMFTLALPAAAEVVIHGRNQPVVVGVMVAIVVGYGFLVGGQLKKLREHDRQPIRQTVEKIRELAGEQTPLTGVFGTSDRQVKTYDPGVRILQEARDVDLLIAEGREKNRPVFVYYCGDVISWRKRKEVAERIAGDRGFERVASLAGLEAMYSYRVLQYRN